MDHVHIYQSRFFEDRIPEIAREFQNLNWTVRRGDWAASLEAMRREMIGGKDFCCAVFVGGMEGILEEAAVFRELHPGKPLIPVGSTGGATAGLLEQMRGQFAAGTYNLLKDEQRYRRIFRQLLPGD
jgi:hypothetical protein